MILFKTDRIKEEYYSLLMENPRLSMLLLALDHFCTLELKKKPVITCIFRTAEENKALYALTPPAERPATSPHMAWEAADLRSSVFTPAEITRVLGFLNTFTYRGGKPVALFHQIKGNAPHFHIQFSKGIT